MGIKLNSRDTQAIKYNTVDMLAVYFGDKLVWKKFVPEDDFINPDDLTLVLSCISFGHWYDLLPWNDNMPWVDKVNINNQ